MIQFFYRALDKRGNEHEGVIAADSYQVAVTKLKDDGFYPTEIYQTTEKDYVKEKKIRQKLFLLRLLRRRVSAKVIVPFVNDLSVLVDSGVSLTRALTILHRQTVSKRFKRIIIDLRSDIESGQNLSDALSKHPRYFSALFVNMVRAGEVGGILADALKRLAALYEKNARLEAKVKAALTYPIVVIMFAIAVVFFIVARIVPEFFVIFNDFDADLPTQTIILHNISMFLGSYWPAVLGVIAALVIAYRILYAVKAVRYLTDAIKVRLPIFGVIHSKVSISRFCRTFGTLKASGVPILQTLSVAKDATGNMVLEQAIERVRESIKEGESIAGPLSHTPLFPPLVTNMIMVGEETGTVSEMLIKIADRYDDEVDTVISQLTSLIEPFLIIGLGIIVGLIVVALFLPLVSVVQNLVGI